MQYNRRLFWCDSVCIAHYSDSLGLNAEPTPTCLWLTVRDEGSGTEISQGDRVTLSYVVSNLRGDTLYNSAVDGIRSVNVGRAEFTIGLDEALVQLRRGADATAILIPEKAYGVRGDAKKVRGRMILRFDFCVIE